MSEYDAWKLGLNEDDAPDCEHCGDVGCYLCEPHDCEPEPQASKPITGVRRPLSSPCPLSDYTHEPPARSPAGNQPEQVRSDVFSKGDRVLSTKGLCDGQAHLFAAALQR